MLHRQDQQPAVSRRRLTLAALGLLGLGPARAGQGIALPTRLVKLATQAEDELLAAIKARDVDRIEVLLGDDFQMIVAQQPATPVAGPDWVEAVRSDAGAADYRVEQMIAREAGNTVLASFTLRPVVPKGVKATRPSVFVVDLWQTDGPQWRLLVRHAALPGGSVRSLPGFAEPEAAPPKKF